MAKKVSRSLFIFGLILCSFATVAQDSKYYDSDGKFKVLFPSTPSLKTNIQPTAVGNVTNYMFISGTSDGAYMVSYVDYPAEQFVDLDKKDLLDRAKNGFVGSLKLEVTDSMFMNYGKHLGILFHAKSDTWHCSVRDYMVENRLYQLGILQMSAISDQEENDFFDSFELVK